MLNAEIFAAIPAMNAASRPAKAIPSRPFGRRSRIRYSMASFGSAEPSISGVTVAPAIMPGMTTMNGTNIFGNAPMIGVLRADDSESAAMERCTSTKLVVQ